MQGVFEDPDFYIAEELMNQIEKTVSQMPETYRVAFEMSRYQDMTYKEIAEELDVSAKVVDYRIQQALKILRTELKETVISGRYLMVYDKNAAFYKKSCIFV